MPRSIESPAPASDAPPPPRRRYGRWRLVSLVAVHLLIIAHVVHWRLAGRTMAPVELNEVMHALELGIVTAGLVLFALALVATAIFGRFFCGWGCHVLALQDVVAAGFRRLGIRAKPLRSRLLPWAAPIAAASMFLAPQVARLARGEPMPAWRVLGPETGRGSFLTDDLWRNLPGPGVGAATFLVIGVLAIWALGTRSFCRSFCPYGAIFKLADAFAPGRIVARGDCTQCGLCTARCDSQVRVHQELTVFGRVVDANCLKDMDCVEACPSGAIAFGFARPAGLKALTRRRHLRYPAFDFTLPEELLAAGTLLAVVLCWRGLYEWFPFLMILALGGVCGFGAVLALRLLTRRDVRLNALVLRRGGTTTRAGMLYAVASLLLAALTVHAGVVRWNQRLGDRAWTALRTRHDADPVLLDVGIERLDRAARIGLRAGPDLRARLAWMHLIRGERRFGGGDPAGAESDARAAVAWRPDDAIARFDLAVVLLSRNARAEAIGHLEEARRIAPDDPDIARLAAMARDAAR